MMRKTDVIVLLPGARMAPATRTGTWRQTLFENNGAKTARDRAISREVLDTKRLPPKLSELSGLSGSTQR
jgi:hypothetical protein